MRRDPLGTPAKCLFTILDKQKPGADGRFLPLRPRPSFARTSNRDVALFSCMGIIGHHISKDTGIGDEWQTTWIVANQFTEGIATSLARFSLHLCTKEKGKGPRKRCQEKKLFDEEKYNDRPPSGAYPKRLATSKIINRTLSLFTNRILADQRHPTATSISPELR